MYTETTLKVGEPISATWPNEVFILVLVDVGAPSIGSFTISYQYSDVDPDEVIKKMTQAERDAYLN